MASIDAHPIESIPDDDRVSRAYFQAPGDLKVRDERAESVYWRKYAPQIDDVHNRGCQLEAKWKAAAASPARMYVGARTAIVGKIRSIVSGRGHRFKVIHYPQNGDIAHTHIAVDRVGGKPQKLSKNDKLELANLIVGCFIDYEAHHCL